MLLDFIGVGLLVLELRVVDGRVGWPQVIVGMCEAITFDIPLEGLDLLVVDRLHEGVMFFPEVLLTPELKIFLDILVRIPRLIDIFESVDEEYLHFVQSKVAANHSPQVELVEPDKKKFVAKVVGRFNDRNVLWRNRILLV